MSRRRPPIQVDPRRCSIRPAPLKTTRVPRICCEKANELWDAVGRAREIRDRDAEERLLRVLDQIAKSTS